MRCRISAMILSVFAWIGPICRATGDVSAEHPSPSHLHLGPLQDAPSPEARSQFGPLQAAPSPEALSHFGPMQPHASPVQDVHVGLAQRQAVWLQVSAIASGVTRSDAIKSAAIANTADAVSVRRIAFLIIADPIAESW